jgi:hypothetical protein
MDTAQTWLKWSWQDDDLIWIWSALDHLWLLPRSCFLNLLIHYPLKKPAVRALRSHPCSRGHAMCPASVFMKGHEPTIKTKLFLLLDSPGGILITLPPLRWTSPLDIVSIVHVITQPRRARYRTKENLLYHGQILRHFPPKSYTSYNQFMAYNVDYV